MLIILLSTLVSFLLCFFLVRYQGFHARFSLDHTEAGPQKFHAMPTPRIGGLGIFFGVIAAYAFAWLSMPHTEWVTEFGYLVLASLPAFAGGLIEDLTKRVSVLKRLILSMVSACIGVWLLDAVVTHLGFFLLDWMFQWAFFAIAFTVFAVGGVVNAVNIIDGFNGIVSGFAGFMLLAIAIISLKLNDIFLLKAALAMLGALLGFLYWNYPYGKIFLGDGGSYLVGFWLAEMAVLIVARHPAVSPWFAALLLIHPVCETLFSVYRRKLLYGKSPWYPDGLHLHTLIFRRLNHIQWASSDARHKAHCNSMTAPYFWVLKAATALLAVLFWNNSLALFVATLLFVMLYVWLYWRIVKFRTPKWLVRKDRRRDCRQELGGVRDRRAPYSFGYIKFRLPRWLKRDRRGGVEDGGDAVRYDRRMSGNKRNTNE